jgi:hypothetical protein
VAGIDDDIKDAVQRFDELERQELLTGNAQVVNDVNVIKDGE